MPLPQLSESERAAALEAAARARKIRAEIKADLKSGKRLLKEVIDLGKSDEVVGKMKVKHFVWQKTWQPIYALV